MPFHDQLPPTAWHGAKVETGTLAARPIPQVVGQLYFVNSGASVGKLFIAEGTAAQTDWKEVADLNNLPLQLTVRDPLASITLTPTTTLVFPTQWLSVSSSTNTATVTMPNAVTVRDQSNAVSQSNVRTIVFPNSSLSSPSSNTVEVSFPPPSSNLTVKDVLQNVNESNVSTIVFPNNTLSVTGSGQVEVTFPPFLSGLTVEDVSQNVSETNVNTIVFPDGSLFVPSVGKVRVTFPSSSSSYSLTVEDVAQSISVPNVTRIVVPDGSLSVIDTGEVELNLSNASITVRDESGDYYYPNINTLEITPSDVDNISNPSANVARIDVRGFELTGNVTDYVKRLNLPVNDLLTPVSDYEYKLNVIPNKDVCAVLRTSNYEVADAVNSSWYNSSLNTLSGSFPFSSASVYSQPSISNNYVFEPQSNWLRLRQPGLYMYKGRLVFRAYNGLGHFGDPDLEVKVIIYDGHELYARVHHFPTRAKLQFIDDASATSTTYSQGVWFEGYFNLRASEITLDFDNDSIGLFYNITLNDVSSTASVDIRFEFFEIIRVP